MSSGVITKKSFGGEVILCRLQRIISPPKDFFVINDWKSH
jgi:hypothetical protein